MQLIVYFLLKRQASYLKMSGVEFNTYQVLVILVVMLQSRCKSFVFASINPTDFKDSTFRWDVIEVSVANGRCLVDLEPI